MSSIIWSINKLHTWDKNPRGIHKDDFDRLKRLITKLGVFKPFVITKDGTVLGGNMRLKACIELGIKEVPVTIVDAPDEKTKVEYALADNDRVGYYEDQALAELIQSVDIDLGDFKVDIGQPLSLKDLLERFGPDTQEDTPPEVSSEPADSVRGGVYQLGSHRLMCGDATLIADMEVLMDKAKADLIFTDPPYNVDYEGYTDDALKIENDKMTPDDFKALLIESFENCNHVSKDGASMYVCHPSSQQIVFETCLNDAAYSVRNQIIWAKNTFAWGMGRYKYQHEPIFYCHKTGQSDVWFGDKTQSTLWQVNKPSAKKEHPTMKPIELVAHALKNSSKAGDVVLDPFGGSGSTMMAAEQTKRVSYTMELDPKYCDVIRKRYATFIGKGDTWQETTPKL